MDADKIANGIPVQINADAQRIAQHFATLAAEGRIIGLVCLGIGPDGSTHTNHSIPMVPSILQLAMGALSALIIDLAAVVKSFQQQGNVSRILKPAPGMVRPNG